jgi:hypothetical protein
LKIAQLILCHIGGERSHQQRILDGDLATIRVALTEVSWLEDVDDDELATVIIMARHALKIAPFQEVVSVDDWLLTVIDHMACSSSKIERRAAR